MGLIHVGPAQLKNPNLSYTHAKFLPKGLIHKRDTSAYLLIRRRIPVSILGTDSENQFP